MDDRATLQDPELERHYQLLFDLFATPAWERFTEEAGRFALGADTVVNVATLESLFFQKGRLDALRWVMGFEGMTRAAYDMLLEQEAGTDVD